MNKRNKAQHQTDPGSETYDAFALLSKEYPEIAKTMSGYVEKLLDLSPFDEKTKQLVYIGVQAGIGYPLAMKYHVPLALQAGATPDEVVAAASIGATAAGPRGFVTCFPAIIEAIKKVEG